MKHWSALLPFAMSLAGLGLIFGHVATSGGVRETMRGRLRISGSSSWRHSCL